MYSLVFFYNRRQTEPKRSISENISPSQFRILLMYKSTLRENISVLLEAQGKFPETLVRTSGKYISAAESYSSSTLYPSMTAGLCRSLTRRFNRAPGRNSSAT